MKEIIVPTVKYGLRYPAASDTPNGPAQLQNLADDVESALGSGHLSWLAYTPSWTASTTNPVLNNGTAAGRYCKVGRTVQFNAKLVIGSTSTVGAGFYLISLPPGLTVSTVGTALCSAYFYDSSAGTEAAKHFVGVGAISASGTTVERIYVVGSASQGLPWSATSPVIPSTDDIIQVSGRYETSVP